MLEKGESECWTLIQARVKKVQAIEMKILHLAFEVEEIYKRKFRNTGYGTQD